MSKEQKALEELHAIYSYIVPPEERIELSTYFSLGVVRVKVEEAIKKLQNENKQLRDKITKLEIENQKLKQPQEGSRFEQF